MMKNGTIFSNVEAGAINRRALPKILPSDTIRIRRQRNLPRPRSSGSEETAEPTPVKTSAAVLVTLAMTGGTPIASRAGYETSEANPANVAVRPAPIPATSKKAKIEKVIVAAPSGICMNVSQHSAQHHVSGLHRYL